MWNIDRFSDGMGCLHNNECIKQKINIRNVIFDKEDTFSLSSLQSVGLKIIAQQKLSIKYPNKNFNF